MPVPKATYPREHTGDPQLDRMQAELGKLRAILANCPFLEGALVEDVLVDTTATFVRHRLGRVPKGVIVLRSSNDSAIGFSATQNTDMSMGVDLKASFPSICTLWFW
jgi:hypothetical protein